MESNTVMAVSGALTTSAFIAAFLVLSMFFLVVVLAGRISTLEASMNRLYDAMRAIGVAPSAPDVSLSSWVPEPEPEAMRETGEAMLRALTEEEEIALEERERSEFEGTTSRNICGAWGSRDEAEAAAEEIERVRKDLHS